MRTLGLVLTIATLIGALICLGLWVAQGQASNFIEAVFCGLIAVYGYWVWRKTT